MVPNVKRGKTVERTVLLPVRIHVCDLEIKLLVVVIEVEFAE